MGLRIQGGGGAGDHDGIFTSCRIEMDRLVIDGFARRGIFISADSALSQGNANGWKVGSVRVSNNGSDGFCAQGGDVNGGQVSLIETASNGGYGVNEISFLGNSYDMIQNGGNALGGFKGQLATNPSSVQFLYDESDQPKSNRSGTRITVLSHIADNGVTGMALSSFEGRLRVQGGVEAFAGSTAVVIAAGGKWLDLYGGDFASGLRFQPTGNGKDFRVAYAGLDVNQAFSITGPNSTNPVGPHTFHVRGFGLNNRYIGSSNAAPPGTWRRGDIINHSDPSTGGIASWVNVAAGNNWQPTGIVGAGQGAAQADSTAADVIALRADLNTLLAKLRSAKLIAT